MRQVVLVCGPSGSGKTALAGFIASSLPGTVLVNQDAYFKVPFTPYAQRSDDRFEGPSIIDWALLRRAVHEARAAPGEFTGDAAVVVVEGHLVGTDGPLVAMAGLIVRLDAAADVCKRRRVHRRPRPVAERAELEAHFDAVVWPGYLKYGSLDTLPERCRAVGATLLTVAPDDERGTADLAAWALAALRGTL